MSSRDLVNRVIGELGANVGIPGMHLDDRGACAMIFDKVIIVNIAHRAEDDQAVLYCQLGHPSDVNREALLSHLLEANFFWNQTQNSTLSLERSTGQVVLMNRLPAPALDLPQLLSVLEAFVNTAEGWMRTLREFEPESDETPPPISEAALMGARA